MQTATFNSGLGTFAVPARTTAVFVAPEGGIAQLSLADGDRKTPEATPTAEPAATVPQPAATAEALAFLTPGPELAETRVPLWVLALILLVGVGAAVACVLYRRQRRYFAMKTVQLRNTGVKVSMFCLGAMRFGWDTDPAMSYRLLDMYVQAGGSFIDTANIYGREGGKRVGGISETLLGDWMNERRNRSQLFIATKVGFEYVGVDRGLRARQIEEECDKSLRRMGIDTIDLFYAHVDDRNTPMEETLQAFDQLIKAGKVRFIGASNFLAWRLEEARWVSQTNGWAEYCCIQQRYSYVRPKPGVNFDPQIAANDDLLDYCRIRGMTMLAYSPLLSGAYTRSDRLFSAQYLGPDTEARMTALSEVAAELGATANQVVLAWMAQSDPPVIPLVAASTLEQMEENLSALQIELNAEQMHRLNSASA